MLLIILTGKKLLELFTKNKSKSCKKQIKKSLEMKKKIKKKAINYMLDGKVTIVHLIVK